MAAIVFCTACIWPMFSSCSAGTLGSGTGRLSPNRLFSSLTSELWYRTSFVWSARAAGDSFWCPRATIALVAFVDAPTIWLMSESLRP